MFSNLDYHDAAGTLFYRFESASGNASPHGHLQRMRWPKTVLNFVSLHGFLVNEDIHKRPFDSMFTDARVG
jgi:hypothetical protein